jgi:AraC-like DNA-binding protein
MQHKEWTKIGHNARLDLSFLHAHYIQHAYPRHSHDYYVISVIERGRQSFLHKGTKYVTPPGGLILINPGAVHTGEAVDGAGFELRSLYPTTAHIEMAISELTGTNHAIPFFKEVRVDDPHVAKNISALHRAMFDASSLLESESRLLWMLTQLIERYADVSYAQRKAGREKKVVQQACNYIEENFAKGISLNELAEYVALSPYHLLRVFRAEVGMPPYTYLESIRVRQAQRLIERGRSLADVAVETGFSSQSHMTRHFKSIIGVTPGEYARQSRA